MIMKRPKTSMSKQKILIISDTHLTRHFDNKKFEFLKNIILDSDKVIINGDFWDSWFTNFDGFVNSKWNNLFPYLLEKKAVYVFGNHDLKEKNDKRVNLFSVASAESYDIGTTNETYHIEHGRKILESENDNFLIVYGKMMQIFEKIHFRIIFYLLNIFEIIGYKIFGKDITRRSKFARNRNMILKNTTRSSWLLCGDTHCPEIDNIKKFANSGCVMHGYGSYLTIDSKEVLLHAKKYS